MSDSPSAKAIVEAAKLAVMYLEHGPKGVVEFVSIIPALSLLGVEPSVSYDLKHGKWVFSVVSKREEQLLSKYITELQRGWRATAVHLTDREGWVIGYIAKELGMGVEVSRV